LLEDRLAPAGNLLVTTAGSYPQQFFKEFTPSGALVRSVTVPPPPGSGGDTARDLVQDGNGRVHVYNGTFTPALATFNPINSLWSQQNYTAWSTASNVSYGGLGSYGNFIFASDMTVAGDPTGQSSGVVRFDTSLGTAVRFASGIDTTDVNVGLDGKVYALSGNVVRAYDPNTLGLLSSVVLPGGNDYRGVAANAAGDLFTANWANTITRFSATGALLGSVTLTGPGGSAWFDNPMDVDVASDGTVAVGTRSGHVVQMTSGLTNVSYFGTWSGSVQYPCFVSFAAPAPVTPTVNVSDYSAPEGNSGPTTFQVPLTLTSPASQNVTVTYSLFNGTAVSGSDYQSASSQNVTFSPGQTTRYIPVTVYGETACEPDETLSVRLTGVSGGAMLGRTQGTVTLLNDDVPTLSVFNQGIYEGSTGSALANFSAYLSAASSQTVTVNYATSPGTATAGTDYQSLAGTLSFAPGQTSQTVTVYAIGDTAQEANETFTLNLSSPTNANLSRAQGTGTIVDDDAPGLTVGNVSVVEGNSGTTYAVFAVILSPAATQTVTVSYATASGTATSGSDFTAASGTLSFSPGQTTRTVSVAVTGELAYETDETFTLNLSNAVNASTRSGTGTATITTDDAIPSLSVSDLTNSEGNVSVTQGWAFVSLSAPSYQPITFTYSTANGTALAGVDYAASGGTLTINPGLTGLSFNIPIYGDTTPEPTKSFFLNVSSATNASIARPQGTITIANDDGPTVRIYGNGVVEGNSGTTLLNFTVQLTAPASQVVSVDYATSDSSAVATPGVDYQPTSGRLTGRLESNLSPSCCQWYHLGHEYHRTEAIPE
jgi:hypothetical protein